MTIVKLTKKMFHQFTGTWAFIKDFNKWLFRLELWWLFICVIYFLVSYITHIPFICQVIAGRFLCIFHFALMWKSHPVNLSLERNKRSLVQCAMVIIHIWTFTFTIGPIILWIQGSSVLCLNYAVFWDFGKTTV